MNKQSLKKYINYTFEDFLQDEYFISSVNNPTDDSIKFWHKLYTTIENKEDFDSAKYYLQSLTVESESLKDSEIDEMWQNIKKANQSGAKKTKRLNIMKYSLRVACVICALAASIPFSLKDKQEDVFAVLDQLSENMETSGESQLILANNEIVTIDGLESTIVYNKDEVLINEQNNTTVRKTENNSNLNHLIIPQGKRSKLTLSEGTKVWVNSGSKVAYPSTFDDKVREIYVDGEVFLDVTPDPNRPFIVKTSKMEVEVLGTSFNVNAYKSDSVQNIVLVTGAVKVKTKNGEKHMTPNKMLAYEDGKFNVSSVDVSTYISWIDGMYKYKNEKLSAILKRLSRYYGQDIIYDKEVANMSCSGKLDLKDSVTKTLEGITYTLPIEYTQVNGKHHFKLAN